MALTTPISVLDLVHVTEGATLDDALKASMELAQLADSLGFHRLWYAEHHNTPELGSSATAILIARAAELTQRIRVGAGGIMLPNHAPLHVAEAFGTLARFFPGRVDLGLGRAPGTDSVTARVLGRSGEDPGSFSRNVRDLAGWFSDSGVADSQPIRGGIATATHVPMWILGSSVEGARVAAQLGLPFVVASHFAPDDLPRVLQVYRGQFDASAPTAQVSRPYVMAGINVMIAPTDAEAERLWTTAQQMIYDVRSGHRRKLQPPVAPELMPAHVRAFADATFRVRAVGSPATACQALREFVQFTGADELIAMTYAYDPADRQRSLRLLAEAWFSHPLDCSQKVPT
ncbi:LLM class flavin-dependent oxidoreductase [Pseudomonas typographi]|uniref:LLM class flavin-dependent oxidoreductase n=1 Tax=Pseudomonas typographi TaxID=2715964 RepID=UPI001683C531|nr:LLM class flavin-dependent oxidoreductase [Pseudomonas typographi]MBD1551434.1 LLM class flavin-dependent oxidoreductase [Pseudomonas typographi]MBD1586488.1 LLM class flavin-dependent oxidoreductase [Pseudomonas typographi]